MFNEAISYGLNNEDYLELGISKDILIRRGTLWEWILWRGIHNVWYDNEVW